MTVAILLFGSWYWVAMPVKAEKFCFWVEPISMRLGLPPAFHADLMTVLSSASVEVRCVPSVGAAVLPAEKPPEPPVAPRETFVTIHDSKPPILRGVAPDCAPEAWFWQAIASRSALVRRPASAVW